MDFNKIVNECNHMMDVCELEQLSKYADISLNKNLNVLEIGGGYGCSTVALALVAKKYDKTIYTIEPNLSSNLVLSLDKFGVSWYVNIIRTPSPWARIDFSSKIGLLFIDGDHETKSVIVDYHYWKRFVDSGGYIAFHDYNNVTGVKRAIDIILETDNLSKLYVHETIGSRGIIIFRNE